FQPVQHEGKVTGLAAAGQFNADCEREIWQLHREIRQGAVSLYQWVGDFHSNVSATMEVNLAYAQKLRQQLHRYSDADIAFATQHIFTQKTLQILDVCKTS